MLVEFYTVTIYMKGILHTFEGEWVVVLGVGIAVDMTL